MFLNDPFSDPEDSPRSPSKTTTEKGRLAESQALHFLSSRGFEILFRNFRIKGGEIDLIGMDGNTLVFVEVRQRTRQDYGGAISTVDWRKQRKILLTAHFFLARHGTKFNQLPCRFDCVFIEGTNQIRWVKNAFDSNGA